jgi:hypothetical protein
VQPAIKELSFTRSVQGVIRKNDYINMIPKQYVSLANEQSLALDVEAKHTKLERRRCTDQFAIIAQHTLENLNLALFAAGYLNG